MNVSTSDAMLWSVVSHRQGHLVKALLGDLQRLHAAQRLPSGWQLGITLNLPEDESFLAAGEGLPLKVHRNASPVGFGANHNAAFRRWSSGPPLHGSTSSFAIVNPDVRLVLDDARPFDFVSLLQTLSAPGVGAGAPLVWTPQGRLEDSARHFPTASGLAIRLLRKAFSLPRSTDHQRESVPIWVDWVAGMFIVFKTEAFAQVRGFDERFFMYFEDTDICRRLSQAGWKVMLSPACHVVHDAQRASHRSVRHLRWHLRSALRFLSGF